MIDDIVFFDCETSGTNPEEHEIIQLGACIRTGENEIAWFNQRVQFDESKADPAALAMNHYKAEDWGDAVTPREAAIGFCNFLNDFRTLPMVSAQGKPYKIAKLGGYNAAIFDINFIDKLMWKTSDRPDKKRFLPASYGVYDVLYLVRWYYYLHPENKPADLQQTTVAEALGIKIEKAHDALADAIASMQIAEWMIERVKR